VENGSVEATGARAAAHGARAGLGDDDRDPDDNDRASWLGRRPREIPTTTARAPDGGCAAGLGNGGCAAGLGAGGRADGLGDGGLSAGRGDGGLAPRRRRTAVKPPKGPDCFCNFLLRT
jgi:hypothetical protein